MKRIIENTILLLLIISLYSCASSKRMAGDAGSAAPSEPMEEMDAWPDVSDPEQVSEEAKEVMEMEKKMEEERRRMEEAERTKMEEERRRREEEMAEAVEEMEMEAPPEGGGGAITSTIGIADEGSILATRGMNDKSSDEGELVYENQFIDISFWNEYTFFPTPSSDTYFDLEFQLMEGKLPEPSEIQVNELLNELRIMPEDPEADIHFSGVVIDAPWNPGNKLMIISFEVGSIGYMENPGWEITFNTDMVKEYRHIGQENLFQALDEITEADQADYYLMMESGENAIDVFELVVHDQGGGEIYAEAVLTYEQAGEKMNRELKIKATTPLTSELHMIQTVTEMGLLLKGSQFAGGASWERIDAQMEKLSTWEEGKNYYQIFNRIIEQVKSID